MFFASWAELEAVSPIVDGIWDKERLLLAQANEVEWKRPFPRDVPPWLE